MIIHQIVIISMLVFAIHYTMLEGEIFDFVRKWWKKREDEYIEEADKRLTLAKDINENDDADKYDDVLARKYTEDADIFFRHQRQLEKISQPIFDCPVCMAPWHGAYLYWLIPWERLGLPAHNWAAWLIIILAALGLNSIIVRVFKDE